ncbi:MAG: histidinol dehydrogenase [Acidobacteria bacterium]|nr:histidinol dehydrogenase [Acidobacteriota bacterium]
MADETARPDLPPPTYFLRPSIQKTLVVLITNSEKLAAVREEIIRQTETPLRRKIIERSLEDYGGIFITGSIDEARARRPYGSRNTSKPSPPTAKPTSAKIHNAGAIFVGAFSPEPVGDYFAGTNHVLPTGDSAILIGPRSLRLSKKTSIVRYT